MVKTRSIFGRENKRKWFNFFKKAKTFQEMKEAFEIKTTHWEEKNIKEAEHHARPKVKEIWDIIEKSFKKYHGEDYEIPLAVKSDFFCRAIGHWQLARDDGYIVIHLGGYSFDYNYKRYNCVNEPIGKPIGIRDISFSCHFYNRDGINSNELYGRFKDWFVKDNEEVYLLVDLKKKVTYLLKENSKKEYIKLPKNKRGLNNIEKSI